MSLFLATDPASVITINGTFWIELVAFLVMLAILWKYAYPEIEKAATSRQKQIADALETAARERAEAQTRLKEAEAKLNEARAQAQEVIAGAAKSGEQLREELRAKGEEEARRQVDKAVKDIEAARQQAVESVRSQVADIVVAVTEKVVGEALDLKSHKRLIDRAIEEIGVGGKR
jgi:F-type H+-transporting ATPase subunit b